MKRIVPVLPTESKESPESVSRQKIFDEISSSDEHKTDDEHFDTHNWIVDINILSDCLQRSCVCNICYEKVKLVEEESFCGGLGTRFSFKCCNKDCTMKEECYSMPKSGKIYNINRKSVLARLATKSSGWLARDAEVC